GIWKDAEKIWAVWPNRKVKKMSVDFQACLRKLQTFSHDLNEASDSLSADLNSVETALNKLKLGIGAWVTIDREDVGEGYERIWTLGHYKLKGKWGLVVDNGIDGVDDGTDDSSAIFLRDASRETRLQAADHLAELIEKLADNTAKTTEKIKERAAEAKKIASALSKGRT